MNKKYSFINESLMDVAVLGGGAYLGNKYGKRWVGHDWIRGMRNAVLSADDPKDAREKLKGYCEQILRYSYDAKTRQKLRKIYIDTDNLIMLNQNDPDWKSIISSKLNNKMLLGSVGGAVVGAAAAQGLRNNLFGNDE